MSPQTIPTRRLGKNGPIVSAIGLGAMGMGAFYGPSDDKESIEALTYAANRGMTFWDTSDIYEHSKLHSNFTADVKLRPSFQWFTETGRRSDIFLATKFGAYDPETGISKPNSKPSYILKSIQRSLAALKTDYIDLYYQHRVDPDVPVEIVLETLRPFVEKGQIKWIGLSECSIAVLKRARAVKGVGERVTVAQMEFNPFELHLEKTGFVDAISEAGMALVAYSSLTRGLVTGRFKSPADFPDDDFCKGMPVPRFSEENFPRNLKVVVELQKFADKYHATTGQITLAWILAEHPNFVPIPGIRNAARVEENAHAAEIALAPDDVKAFRAVVEAAEVVGERYQAVFMPKIECIPLSEWKGEH
ncbi:hypothetical protein DXG01_008280 [Tephrocybe rancida]|nr:hypothetical protein DXG01_008280 [Tephrocybe rancida]